MSAEGGDDGAGAVVAGVAGVSGVGGDDHDMWGVAGDGCAVLVDVGGDDDGHVGGDGGRWVGAVTRPRGPGAAACGGCGVVLEALERVGRGGCVVLGPLGSPKVDVYTGGGVGADDEVAAGGV